MQLKELGLQELIIDFKNNSSHLRSLYAKEGDIGSRGIKLKIVNNSVEVDLSNITATLYARPHDAISPYEVKFTAVNANKGEYEVIYTTDMLQSEVVYCEVVLRDVSGNRLTTKSLKLYVDAGLVTDSAIEGHDSFPLFEQLLLAGANESARVASENLRKDKEDNRVMAESSRATAEAQRVGAEALRDAEFITKIDDFVAETERVEGLYPARITKIEQDLTTHKEDYANLVIEVNKKANKQQEEWITPTLVNGATGTFKYRKNSIGQLEIIANLNITTFGSTILTLVSGNLPSESIIDIINKGSASSAEVGKVLIGTNGNFQIHGTAANYRINKTYVL